MTVSDRKNGGYASQPGNWPLGANLLCQKAWAKIARSLRLSRRELQISRAVFDDLTEPAIASELGVSSHTVHEHLNRLHQKLQVRTRVGLILRIMSEFKKLLASNRRWPASLCRERANGRCPLCTGADH